MRYRLLLIASVILLSGCATNSKQIILPDGTDLSIVRDTSREDTITQPVVWQTLDEDDTHITQVVRFTKPGYQFDILRSGDGLPQVVDIIWLNKEHQVVYIAENVRINTHEVIRILAPSNTYSWKHSHLPVYAIIILAGEVEVHGIDKGDRFRIVNR